MAGTCGVDFVLLAPGFQPSPPSEGGLLGFVRMQGM